MEEETIVDSNVWEHFSFYLQCILCIENENFLKNVRKMFLTRKM